MVCSVGTGTVAEYYLNEQAEYYTGGMEPKGLWYSPAATFDLEDGSAINAETFHNLHAGISPGGVRLGQHNNAVCTTRVGGYDLTFSAPKSVSILWAVSDDDVRMAIEQAQEAATRAALNVLQEHAGYARRGKGGTNLEKVEFFGATFQHGEARPVQRPDGTFARDPQLHTHSVIFNLAQRGDGTWGALDGRHFYKWKMTAGALYRARLAHELQHRLEVEIETQESGLFEVKGITEEVRNHFSSRRGEIEGNLAARGLKSRDAQALASAITKASRRSKSAANQTLQDRHDRWKQEAEELGLCSVAIDACVNRPKPTIQSMTFSEKIRKIHSQLTEHDAVFRLEALYRAGAETALTSGASTDQVDRAVAQMMQDGDVVEIGRDELGLSVFSTSEMVCVEDELVDLAESRGKLHKHRLMARKVEPYLQSGDLTEEQQEAVRFVTYGADVAVMEGSAGAGKTHALRTVVDAYHGEGYRVIGTSTAWRMARQLGDDLEIESRATDAWLAQAKVDKPFLDANTVLVVDEAGQLSSRQMLEVMRAAEDAQAKIILTGDQRQLQAIGAGPGLRLVAEQVGVVRIDTIVRQREAWARKAVEDLSLGHADKAISAFEENDALVWCVDGKDTVQKAVEGWKVFKESSPDLTALVLAKSNVQVKALNVEMRTHLREEGHLKGEEHVINVVDTSGRPQDLMIAHGDQIVFKRRIDELGVINGSLGTVTHIESDQTGLNLSIDINSRSISFITSAIADENGRVPLAHGYASTIFSAQGATVDAAYVVADHTMKRNEAYVAASRAREITCLYLNREKIKSAARSQRLLSEPARSGTSNEGLRQFLVKSWGRAQIKSSTRDYVPSRSFKRERGMSRMPEIEIGR